MYFFIIFPGICPKIARDNTPKFSSGSHLLIFTNFLRNSLKSFVLEIFKKFSKDNHKSLLRRFHQEFLQKIIWKIFTKVTCFRNLSNDSIIVFTGHPPIFPLRISSRIQSMFSSLIFIRIIKISTRKFFMNDLKDSAEDFFRNYSRFFFCKISQGSL